MLEIQNTIPSRRYNEPNGTPLDAENRHQVRKVATAVLDLTAAPVAVLNRHRGKSIAVDDKGRVYLAEGSDTDVAGPRTYTFLPLGERRAL